MDREQWEAAKGIAWMELRHASFALAGKGNSYLVNDHAFADAKLSQAAMEYARVMRAKPEVSDG